MRALIEQQRATLIDLQWIHRELKIEHVQNGGELKSGFYHNLNSIYEASDHVFVFLHNQIRCGFVLYEKDQNEPCLIWFLPAYRKRKFGTHVMQNLEFKQLSLGNTAMTVSTTPESTEFWVKIGYHQLHANTYAKPLDPATFVIEHMYVSIIDRDELGLKRWNTMNDKRFIEACVQHPQTCNVTNLGVNDLRWGSQKLVDPNLPATSHYIMGMSVEHWLVLQRIMQGIGLSVKAHWHTAEWTCTEHQKCSDDSPVLPQCWGPRTLAVYKRQLKRKNDRQNAVPQIHTNPWDNM